MTDDPSHDPNLPPLRVAHAGSLGPLLEELAANFQELSRRPVRLLSGEGGSVGLAKALAEGRLRADLFLPADASVNRLVLGPGSEGALDWYVVFARTSRVLAYSPASRWAAELATGKDWPRLLADPALRLGRSDPDLDPGGYYTVLGLRAAEEHYGRPGLARAVLGDDRTPLQLLPTPLLRRGLATGEIDVQFLYRNGAIEREAPFLELPPEINFAEPRLADRYARFRYTTSRGEVFRGAPIYYTAGVLRGAEQPEASLAFVRFLLSPTARATMQRHGLLDTPVFGGGDLSRLPESLVPLVAGPLPQPPG